MDGYRSDKIYNLKPGADAGKALTKEWYTWEFIAHKKPKRPIHEDYREFLESILIFLVDTLFQKICFVNMVPII